MKFDIHTDGGSRGNPGPASAGIVIRQRESGQLWHEAGYFLGRTTNNVAEYQGLLKALKLAADYQSTDLHIHSDSELMVRQVRGQYKVKSPDLKPLYEQVRDRLTKFARWKIEHVYREQNSRADELANAALDAGRDVIVCEAGQLKTSASPRQPAAASPANTGALVSWTATLQREPGPTCPANTKANLPHLFGAIVPEGFCVHAAEAVLRDGPLHWPATRQSLATQCPHCRVRIVLQREE